MRVGERGYDQGPLSSKVSSKAIPYGARLPIFTLEKTGSLSLEKATVVKT